jgi:threonine aldolase
MQSITAQVSSVHLELSKGLAAPVGGLVAGSQAFIARAHRARKVLGGGMRQAGIIAAAGIVAMTEMVDRLADDHAHARRLAEGLAAIPQIAISPEHVQTNIVVCSLRHPDWTPQAFIAALREQGVLISGFGDHRLRLVTHYGIERDDIDRTLLAAARVFSTAA